MKNFINHVDTSSELILARHGNGMKLMRPESVARRGKETVQTFHSLGEILNYQTFNVFVMDTEGVVVSLNEAEAQICGFDSVEDGIGVKLLDYRKDAPAQLVRQNDIEVMQSQRYKIADEYFSFKNDIIYSFLTIKYPLFNKDDKLVGVFGVSIAHYFQSLATAILELGKIGIIPLQKNHYIPAESGMMIDDAIISKREIDVLRFTIRGHTAKQIADALCLSRRTVEQHLENVKNKLGVRSKSELIEKVIDELV